MNWPAVFRSTMASRHDRIRVDVVALPFSSSALMAVLLLVIVLSFTAAPRRTGDAHQYIAMARQFARLQPPSLSIQDETQFTRWLGQQPQESGFPESTTAIRQPALVRDNRQEFSHFWIYPLLVTPLLAVSDVAGAHPVSAFTAVNSALVAAALWTVARTFGIVSALIMLASPIVWFISRAQVEAFTFSVLVLAVAAGSVGRWGVASVLVAVASTQNLPIAAVIPIFWIAGSVDWALGQRAAGRPFALDNDGKKRVLAVVAATTLIAALHPAYYLVRLGVLTPQELNGGITGAIPTTGRILAPIVDLNIGLVPWLPVTAAVWLGGTVLLFSMASRRIDVPSRTWLLALCTTVCGAWFLLVFAQTTNVNSGGAVHMSRYVLWLLPLMLPAISVATNHLQRLRPNATIAAVSALALVYVGYFHPDQPERYVEHSPQASWVIDNAPALYRPIPEIFVERALHIDGGARASATVESCRVIFLLKSSPSQPCPLRESERATVEATFAAGASGLWVRRGADGSSSVSVAS